MSWWRLSLGQVSELLDRFKASSRNESADDSAEPFAGREPEHWSAPRRADGSRNYLVFALEILFVSVIAFFWL